MDRQVKNISRVTHELDNEVKEQIETAKNMAKLQNRPGSTKLQQRNSKILVGNLMSTIVEENVKAKKFNNKKIKELLNETESSNTKSNISALTFSDHTSYDVDSITYCSSHKLSKLNVSSSSIDLDTAKTRGRLKHRMRSNSITELSKRSRSNNDIYNQSFSVYPVKLDIPKTFKDYVTGKHSSKGLHLSSSAIEKQTEDFSKASERTSMASIRVRKPSILSCLFSDIFNDKPSSATSKKEIPEKQFNLARILESSDGGEKKHHSRKSKSHHKRSNKFEADTKPTNDDKKRKKKADDKRKKHHDRHVHKKGEVSSKTAKREVLDEKILKNERNKRKTNAKDESDKATKKEKEITDEAKLSATNLAKEEIKPSLAALPKIENSVKEVRRISYNKKAMEQDEKSKRHAKLKPTITRTELGTLDIPPFKGSLKREKKKREKYESAENESVCSKTCSNNINRSVNQYPSFIYADVLHNGTFTDDQKYSIESIQMILERANGSSNKSIFGSYDERRVSKSSIFGNFPPSSWMSSYDSYDSKDYIPRSESLADVSNRSLMVISELNPDLVYRNEDYQDIANYKLQQFIGSKSDFQYNSKISIESKGVNTDISCSKTGVRLFNPRKANRFPKAKNQDSQRCTFKTKSSRSSMDKKKTSKIPISINNHGKNPEGTELSLPTTNTSLLEKSERKSRIPMVRRMLKKPRSKSKSQIDSMESDFINQISMSQHITNLDDEIIEFVGSDDNPDLRNKWPKTNWISNIFSRESNKASSMYVLNVTEEITKNGSSGVSILSIKDEEISMQISLPKKRRMKSRLPLPVNRCSMGMANRYTFPIEIDLDALHRGQIHSVRRPNQIANRLDNYGKELAQSLWYSLQFQWLSNACSELKGNLLSRKIYEITDYICILTMLPISKSPDNVWAINVPTVMTADVADEPPQTEPTVEEDEEDNDDIIYTPVKRTAMGLSYYTFKSILRKYVEDSEYLKMLTPCLKGRQQKAPKYVMESTTEPILRIVPSRQCSLEEIEPEIAALATVEEAQAALVEEEAAEEEMKKLELEMTPAQRDIKDVLKKLNYIFEIITDETPSPSPSVSLESSLEAEEECCCPSPCACLELEIKQVPDKVLVTQEKIDYTIEMPEGVENVCDCSTCRGTKTPCTCTLADVIDQLYTNLKADKPFVRLMIEVMKQHHKKENLKKILLENRETTVEFVDDILGCVIEGNTLDAKKINRLEQKYRLLCIDALHPLEISNHSVIFSADPDDGLICRPDKRCVCGHKKPKQKTCSCSTDNHDVKKQCKSMKMTDLSEPAFGRVKNQIINLEIERGYHKMDIFKRFQTYNMTCQENEKRPPLLWTLTKRLFKRVGKGSPNNSKRSKSEQHKPSKSKTSAKKSSSEVSMGCSKFYDTSEKNKKDKMKKKKEEERKKNEANKKKDAIKRQKSETSGGSKKSLKACNSDCKNKVAAKRSKDSVGKSNKKCCGAKKQKSEISTKSSKKSLKSCSSDCKNKGDSRKKEPRTKSNDSIGGKRSAESNKKAVKRQKSDTSRGSGSSKRSLKGCGAECKKHEDCKKKKLDDGKKEGAKKQKSETSKSSVKSCSCKGTGGKKQKGKKEGVKKQKSDTSRGSGSSKRSLKGCGAECKKHEDCKKKKLDDGKKEGAKKQKSETSKSSLKSCNCKKQKGKPEKGEKRKQADVSPSKNSCCTAKSKDRIGEKKQKNPSKEKLGKKKDKEDDVGSKKSKSKKKKNATNDKVDDADSKKKKPECACSKLPKPPQTEGGKKHDKNPKKCVTACSEITCGLVTLQLSEDTKAFEDEPKLNQKCRACCNNTGGLLSSESRSRANIYKSNSKRMGSKVSFYTLDNSDEMSLKERNRSKKKIKSKQSLILDTPVLPLSMSAASIVKDENKGNKIDFVEPAVRYHPVSLESSTITVTFDEAAQHAISESRKLACSITENDYASKEKKAKKFQSTSTQHDCEKKSLAKLLKDQFTNTCSSKDGKPKCSIISDLIANARTQPKDYSIREVDRLYNGYLSPSKSDVIGKILQKFAQKKSAMTCCKKSNNIGAWLKKELESIFHTKAKRSCTLIEEPKRRKVNKRPSSIYDIYRNKKRIESNASAMDEDHVTMNTLQESTSSDLTVTKVKKNHATVFEPIRSDLNQQQVNYVAAAVLQSEQSPTEIIPPMKKCRGIHSMQSKRKGWKKILPEKLIKMVNYEAKQQHKPKRKSKHEQINLESKRQPLLNVAVNDLFHSNKEMLGQLSGFEQLIEMIDRTYLQKQRLKDKENVKKIINNFIISDASKCKVINEEDQLIPNRSDMEMLREILKRKKVDNGDANLAKLIHYLDANEEEKSSSEKAFDEKDAELTNLLKLLQQNRGESNRNKRKFSEDDADNFRYKKNRVEVQNYTVKGEVERKRCDSAKRSESAERHRKKLIKAERDGRHNKKIQTCMKSVNFFKHSDEAKPAKRRKIGDKSEYVKRLLKLIDEQNDIEQARSRRKSTDGSEEIKKLLKVIDENDVFAEKNKKRKRKEDQNAGWSVFVVNNENNAKKFISNIKFNDQSSNTDSEPFYFSADEISNTKSEEESSIMPSIGWNIYVVNNEETEINQRIIASNVTIQEDELEDVKQEKYLSTILESSESESANAKQQKMSSGIKEIVQLYNTYCDVNECEHLKQDLDSNPLEILLDDDSKSSNNPKLKPPKFHRINKVMSQIGKIYKKIAHPDLKPSAKSPEVDYYYNLNRRHNGIINYMFRDKKKARSKSEINRSQRTINSDIPSLKSYESKVKLKNEELENLESYIRRNSIFSSDTESDERADEILSNIIAQVYAKTLERNNMRQLIMGATNTDEEGSCDRLAKFSSDERQMQTECPYCSAKQGHPKIRFAKNRLDSEKNSSHVIIGDKVLLINDRYPRKNKYRNSNYNDVCKARYEIATRFEEVETSRESFSSNYQIKHKPSPYKKTNGILTQTSRRRDLDSPYYEINNYNKPSMVYLRPSYESSEIRETTYAYRNGFNLSNNYIYINNSQRSMYLEESSSNGSNNSRYVLEKCSRYYFDHSQSDLEFFDEISDFAGAIRSDEVLAGIGTYNNRNNCRRCPVTTMGKPY